MPSRKRYTAARGFGNRIVDPFERLLVGAAGMPLHLVSRRPTSDPLPFDAGSLREILVLRLDRIGDVTMTLPALADLRAAVPHARIRLAVGRWSTEIARRAPVDQILEWNAPWVGRRDEGADSWRGLLGKAGSLRGILDLAVDLSCDPRANLLLWRSGARRRAGYGNSGFRGALTHVLPLDETTSWVDESRRAVERITGRPRGTAWPAVVSATERSEATQRLVAAGLRPGGPVVGLHPGGGRPVKQWPIGKWLDVAKRLRDDHGARFVLTGSLADKGLTSPLALGLGDATVDTAGSLTLSQSLGVLSVIDLFLSPDTGPMHLACAVGTPSVTVFGPSDPRRFFSGGTGRSGSRHVVVSAPLWCAPCNQIRRPPAECLGPHGPECLQLVAPEAVYNEASRLLTQGGFPHKNA